MALINTLIFSSVILIEANGPYAVYADGTRTNVAYTITAGDKQTILVKDEKTAEKARAREAIRRAMLNVLEGCASPATKVKAAGYLMELEKDAH